MSNQTYSVINKNTVDYIQMYMYCITINMQIRGLRFKINQMGKVNNGNSLKKDHF